MFGRLVCVEVVVAQIREDGAVTRPGLGVTERERLAGQLEHGVLAAATQALLQ